MWRDRNVYYRFHKTYGHKIDRSRDLMNQIESLIRNRRLQDRQEETQRRSRERDEQANETQHGDKRRVKRQNPLVDNQPTNQVIYVISEGETMAGHTSSLKIAYA